MTEVSIPQAIQFALQLHQNGRLAEAEAIYRQILALEPNNVDALHLLGLMAHQHGRHQAAIDSISRAIALHPGIPEHHINIASAHRALGQLPQAVEHLRAAIKLRPTNVLANHVLAVSLYEMGQLDEPEAIWRRLCELEPNVAAHPSNLGALLERKGRLDEALASNQRAIAIDPKYAPGHNNFGAVLGKLGRLPEAIAAHQKSVALRPDFADAWINLASTQQELGQLAPALEAAKRATELRPEDPTAFRILALVLEEHGRLDLAAQAFDRAIALLKQRTQGLSANDRSTDLDWLNRLQVMRAIMLPPVYGSLEELTTRRTQLISNLQVLHESGVRLHLGPELAPTLFSLAYQGHDDRAISESYTRLIVPAKPGPTANSRSATKKIHVALISRFFREHTIGRLYRGLVANLNRDEFTVTVFSVGDPQDSVARFMKEHADQYVPLAPLLGPAQNAVAAAAPDILFFTDIGMDPVTFSLAFTRLAPVQCVTWGHPVTTAIPTVDYFISSPLLDPPGNESHYTEKLIRLPELAAYYYRPQLTARKTRHDFGLPEDATLYGCLQMLWKFHPDFDQPIADILRRDPRGRLLLIRGLNQNWDNLLMDRFRRSMPDVADRIIWLPRQSYTDFLALTALCDVMLDPIHFGGGNTTYEALAFDVPVITLPSPFLRGRLTLAMYRMMGLDDCVADSVEVYADRAVAIATDSHRRQAIREKISQRSPVLFENEAALRNLEEFFRKVAHR